MIHKKTEIINYFINNPSPCKSSDIGKELNLCSKTIRNTIKEMQSFCNENGFSIQAKRNYGYEIIVHNPALYDSFLHQFNTNNELNKIIKYNDNAAFLFITRSLISNTDWIKMETFLEQINYSKSTLNSILSEITSYLTKRQLTIIHKKGKGTKVLGKEIYFRLALIQLIGPANNIYDTTSDSLSFNQFTTCKRELFERIKHIFLTNIVKNGLHFNEGNTEILTIYLIVLMNRKKFGFHIPYKDEFSFITSTKSYQVSFDIFTQLNKEFNELFTFDINEIYQFAVLMYGSLDLIEIEDYLFTLQNSPIANQLEEIHNDCIQFINHTFHINLNNYKEFSDMFKIYISKIIFKHYFDFVTKLTFEGNIANKLTHLSPLTCYLGFKISQYLESKHGLYLNINDYYRFTNLFYSLLQFVKPPIRKKKILVSSGLGLFHSSYLFKDILNEYEEFIEEYDSCELNECAYIDTNKYDLFLCDFIQGPTPQFSKIDIPVCQFNWLARDGKSKENLQKYFIDCYQIQDYLIKNDGMNYYENVNFSTLEQIYQFVVFKNCTNPNNHMKLISEFETIEKTIGFNSNNNTIVLLGNKSDFGKECMDIIHLDKKILYKGNKITTVIFYALDFSSPIKCKIVELYLSQFVIDFDIEQLKSNKTDYLNTITQNRLLYLK